MDAFTAPGHLAGLHHLIGRHRHDHLVADEHQRPAVFLYGLVLVRLAGRRVFGKLAAFDIVLAIMVGSNLSRTPTANAPFLPTLAATAAIAVAHGSITFLALHSKLVDRLVKGASMPLVHEGEVDWRAMRRYGLSEDDLAEAARNAGVFDLDQVRTAVIESNGRISVRSRGQRSP